MSNVGSSCCCCSIGIAWALARKSHSIRGRKWCQQQQTVCRQGREYVCLMCCFFFASLLHLPLPPPHPKRCPIKLCIPAVEIAVFHLVSFGHWDSWEFLQFLSVCSLFTFFPQEALQIHQCFVTFPAALTGSTFRLMSHTRSFMRSCWQLWKRRVGLLWNEKATKGNRC